MQPSLVSRREPPTKFPLHQLPIVETEQSVRVVDQDIEMSEEVFSQDAVNARVRSLNWSEILDDDDWLHHHVGADLQ